jgi:hypothetical protein
LRCGSATIPLAAAAFGGGYRRFAALVSSMLVSSTCDQIPAYLILERALPAILATRGSEAADT